MNTVPENAAAPKDFAAWYGALSDAAKNAYANRAGTTRNYIESHLLMPTRIPRAAAMRELATASEEFTLDELAAWFYRKSLERSDNRRVANQ